MPYPKIVKEGEIKDRRTVKNIFSVLRLKIYLAADQSGLITRSFTLCLIFALESFEI